MKPRRVLAEVLVDRRQISAHFHLSTGHLFIRDGATLVEAIRAPDSWIALAAVNTASAWGTRPSSADLKVFLERYIALSPEFFATRRDSR
jgi:hypothetical protein